MGKKVILILKERRSGATTNAIRWLRKKGYNEIARTYRVFISHSLQSAKYGERLWRDMNWRTPDPDELYEAPPLLIGSQGHLCCLRGGKWRKIVLDEFGYYDKPLTDLKEVATHFRFDAEIMLIIDKESYHNFVINSIKEIFGDVEVELFERAKPEPTIFSLLLKVCEAASDFARSLVQRLFGRIFGA